MMIEWEKAPGGKRYTARTAVGTFRLVRQNVAAGAKRWKATLETEGTTFVVVKTDSFQEAKAACEARVEARVVHSDPAVCEACRKTAVDPVVRHDRVFCGDTVVCGARQNQAYQQRQAAYR